MLKLSQPITSINGFKIGDKVRLKDGDGRPHIIKSFSIDGMKEFFFEVKFEDGTEAILDNISPLPSNLDEAAEEYCSDNTTLGATCRACFRDGAEWMAGQGITKEAVIGMATEEISINVSQETLNELDLCPGDKVVVQIRKKQ